jgi:hypothetical protein
MLILLCGVSQVLVGLFRTQLLLAGGQYDSAGTIISMCAEQLQVLASSGAHAILLAQLQLHLVILNGLLLLGKCNIKALSKPSCAPIASS